MIEDIKSSNIVLLVEYDGTNYCGWQSQKNAKSIQDTLQNAIYNLTGENVKLTGCSRTDSGVHAKGHVSNFIMKSNIPIEKLPIAINSFLPIDISVKNAKLVSDDFNARFCSIGKIYRYNLWNEPTRSALYHNFSYHVPKLLDIEAMKAASENLTGTKDFCSFMASGSCVKSTVRTLYSVEIQKEDCMVGMVFHGDGFLYNMVRILSGTLYYVGLGKICPSQIKSIIDEKNRKNAGKTLPANGLILEKVFYEQEIFLA